MKDLPRWVVEANTASLQQIFAVQKTRMESCRAEKFATILAAADHPLSRKAKTNRARQVLKASLVLRAYAAGEARVAQCFF